MKMNQNETGSDKNNIEWVHIVWNGLSLFIKLDPKSFRIHLSYGLFNQFAISKHCGRLKQLIKLNNLYGIHSTFII